MPRGVYDHGMAGGVWSRTRLGSASTDELLAAYRGQVAALREAAAPDVPDARRQMLTMRVVHLRVALKQRGALREYPEVACVVR